MNLQTICNEPVVCIRFSQSFIKVFMLQDELRVSNKDSVSLIVTCMSVR